jgi:RNA 3'-terminal phosphate cyclase (ATP)
MISIDGSRGEGGGQILRSGLSLSMVTGQPFRIRNIRSKRPKPGLLRQHLTAVRAAKEVCAARVSGAELGSTTLDFDPGPVAGGDYRFSIATAGSTTLVAQTVLPALMIADRPSHIELSGGTHNPFAPTTCFLSKCYLPLIERMGPTIRLELVRHGFYPAGGGVVRLDVDPVARLSPIELVEPRPIVHREAVALISGLPGSIADREVTEIAEKLGWGGDELKVRHLGREFGPGNVLHLEVEREDLTEMIVGFGERGVSAERVAARAAGELKKFIAADVAVWKHLADQLLLPMAIAKGGRFSTGPLTPHFESNAEVIEMFTGLKIHRDVSVPGKVLVSVMA